MAVTYLGDGFTGAPTGNAASVATTKILDDGSVLFNTSPIFNYSPVSYRMRGLSAAYGTAVEWSAPIIDTFATYAPVGAGVISDIVQIPKG